MPNLVATAQFVPPVTPDEVTRCSASQVQNTGTSAIGDLQVIVWDGDEPGISFIDHSSTPANAICFSLISHNGENLVKDPDVVWDYGGGDLVLVVYEEHRGASVSVWSQMWRWNNGSPALETAYGTSGYLQLGQNNSTFPNVDADFNGNAVAVWAKSPHIYAKTIDFSSLTASSHLFWVNECATAGIEPDVAMRNFNDNTHISFVYADPINIDIIVAQELINTVQSSNSTCNHIALAKPTGIPIDFVGVPRIAMPNWDFSVSLWRDGWDAAVVYEGKNSTGYLIITSNRITHWTGWIQNSYPWIPPYTWYCGAHTYSSPAFTSPTGTEWISDILNVSGINLAHPSSINQINHPQVDLHTDGSIKPVVAQAGDMITYNAWTWEDNSSQFSGYDEILMRRLILGLDGEPINPVFVTPNDILTGEYQIPLPSNQDYYLVSDATASNQHNNVASITGTSSHAYFAFVYKGLGNDNIVFKRTVQAPNTAVRKAQVFAELMQEQNKSIIFPNPTQGELWIKNPEKIISIKLTSLDGRSVVNLTSHYLKYSKINLKNFDLTQGIYLLEIIDNNSNKTHYKISFLP